MPQLNFYATVITPSVQTFETLTVMMNGFVTQGMQIAKSRPYTSPREGGIGLFDLRAFVASLQFTWVERAHLCCNVNWKYDLREMCGGEIVGIGNLINTNIGLCGPLLLGIIDSFKTFHHKFASTGKNFTLLPIYCNHLFGHGRNMQNKFNNVFFSDQIENRFLVNIRSVKWIDLEGGRENIDSRIGINTRLGLNISPMQYPQLKASYEVLKKGLKTVQMLSV